MENSLVSVIVPVYNIPGDYLKMCINSIINQSHELWELLLVDDGSSENYRTECDELGKLDRRIIVIHQSNQGASVARNRGLDNAQGDFIAFIDADDFIDGNYIEFLLGKMFEHKADIAICDYDLVFTNGRIVSCQIKEDKDVLFEGDSKLKQVLLRKHFGCSSASRIYRRSLAVDCRFPLRIKNGEDIFFTWKVFKNANRIVYSSDAKYHYRQRKGSAVHMLYNEDRKGVIIVTKDIMDECLKNHLELVDAAMYRYSQAILEVVEHSLLDRYTLQLKMEIRKYLIVLLKSNEVTIKFKIAAIISSFNIKAYRLMRKMQTNIKETDNMFE